jgi:hypothetical protein
MSLDGPGWQALGAIANILGTAGGLATISLGTTGAVGYIIRDGFLVPLYLRSARKHLASARSVIDSLSDEQKANIEELRQGTEQSLNSIIEQYEKCVHEILSMELYLYGFRTSEKFYMVEIDQKNGGLRRRLWPTRNDRDLAVNVKEQAQSVYEDVLVSIFFLTNSLIFNHQHIRRQHPVELARNGRRGLRLRNGAESSKGKPR